MRKLPNRPTFVITERLVSYFICGFFSLALWGIAIWVWNILFNYFVPLSDRRWDWTIVLTVVVLPLPFWVYQSLFSSDRPLRTPAAPPTAAPVAGGAMPAKPDQIAGLGWLYWLGAGELHRGTLVILVVLFWSLFYWNWSTVQAMIERGQGVFAFSFWGLITIFGMVFIRSIFSRLPGGEVPGAGDSKSKPK
jgi:hypothetical protein